MFRQKFWLWPVVAGAIALFGAPALAASPTVDTGSQGWAVSVLQADLTNIGLYHGSSSGYFGNLTASAVEAFKQGFGLGGGLTTVDSGTWSSLNSYLQQRFNPVSGSLGSAALTIGDIGPGVVDLQGDLMQLGYNPGPANGVFNNRTGHAVMAFQKDHGLPVTEVADHATATAVIQAMGQGNTPPASAPTPAPAAAPAPASPPTPEIDGHQILRVIHLVATAYSPSYQDNYPYGATDAFGNPLESGTVAVDPSVIPLKTHLYITGYKFSGLPTGGFQARAMDTGGAIQGNRVDIFIPGSESYVNSFGMQPVTVYVLAN